MTRIPTSLLITWIVTSLVAIVVWLVVPGSSMDRSALRLLAEWQTGGPVKISGEGSTDEPWRILGSTPSATMQVKPATIALEDNLEGIFQGSPHTPIDMAVIFRNLQRLGTRDLACSVLLAWEEPDPIALAALENMLLEFDSVVLAAPVTRGAIMEAMPADFRRASLSIEEVRGDPSALPVVNRVSIPTRIAGADNAMAGFEVIDSEPSADHLNLLARWDERIILAFPVVAALQQLGLELNDLEIEVGSHLQLGARGPRIPIDEFGRLAIDKVSVAPPTDLLAKELIDAEAGSPGLPAMTGVILCDLRSHADIGTRDFNRLIPTSVAKLMHGQSRAREMTVARINSSYELPILLVLALLLSLASLAGRRAMGMISLLALGALALSIWLGIQAGIWLPAYEALLLITVTLGCAAVCSSKRKRTTSMPRLDRLEFESTGFGKPVESTSAPDKPEEEQDYALPPKD